MITEKRKILCMNNDEKYVNERRYNDRRRRRRLGRTPVCRPRSSQSVLVCGRVANDRYSAVVVYLQCSPVRRYRKLLSSFVDTIQPQRAQELLLFSRWRHRPSTGPLPLPRPPTSSSSPAVSALPRSRVTLLIAAL